MDYLQRRKYLFRILRVSILLNRGVNICIFRSNRYGTRTNCEKVHQVLYRRYKNTFTKNFIHRNSGDEIKDIKCWCRVEIKFSQKYFLEKNTVYSVFVLANLDYHAYHAQKMIHLYLKSWNTIRSFCFSIETDSFLEYKYFSWY